MIIITSWHTVVHTAAEIGRFENSDVFDFLGGKGLIFIGDAAVYIFELDNGLNPGTDRRQININSLQQIHRWAFLVEFFNGTTYYSNARISQKIAHNLFRSCVQTFEFANIH